METELNQTKIIIPRKLALLLSPLSCVAARAEICPDHFIDRQGGPELSLLRREEMIGFLCPRAMRAAMA